MFKLRFSSSKTSFLGHLQTTVFKTNSSLDLLLQMRTITLYHATPKLLFLSFLFLSIAHSPSVQHFLSLNILVLVNVILDLLTIRWNSIIFLHLRTFFTAKPTGKALRTWYLFSTCTFLVDWSKLQWPKSGLIQNTQ